MSGHDLARDSGLGEQRDHRLGEMPLPVRPVQPLIGDVGDGDVDGYFCTGSGGRIHAHQKSDD